MKLDKKYVGKNVIVKNKKRDDDFTYGNDMTGIIVKIVDTYFLVLFEDSMPPLLVYPEELKVVK